MPQSQVRDFQAFPSLDVPARIWNIGSVLVAVIAILISVVVITVHSFGKTEWAFFSATAALFITALLHARFISLARVRHRQSTELLFSKERELQSLFENVLDAVLVFDGKGICQDANPSASELLASRRTGIVGQPIRLWFSNPREFDSLWRHLIANQGFQGEAELVRADGATLLAEFSVAMHFLPNSHLIILRDFTQRRRAQQALHQSLVAARSSRQEADALRAATLALTEDLRMDHVLNTLLDTLARFVPYEEAQLLLLETGSRLFLAHRAGSNNDSNPELEISETFDLSGFPILSAVLESEEGLIIDDASQAGVSKLHNIGTRVRSWIGVPILSSHQVLGVLLLAHSAPAHFSRDHLRLTCLLATSVAVAIQNARLYERSEICAMELENRISELRRRANDAGSGT